MPDPIDEWRNPLGYEERYAGVPPVSGKAVEEFAPLKPWPDPIRRGDSMSTGEGTLSVDLMPGVRVRSAAKTVTLASRKDDNSGWWLVEGGGLADYVLDGMDWYVVDVVKLTRCFHCNGTGVRHA